MHLTELLSGIACEITGDADISVTSLCHRTDRVTKGCLFICIKGGQADSHEMAYRAVYDGAKVVVVERLLPNIDATQILVANSRSAMALMAKNFYKHACQKLKIICIIGTNGKTSTAYLARAIFEAAGYKTAVIGTNGVFIGEKRYDSELTTPDPIELHNWFAKMAEEQVKYVFMEASAHAIQLNKLDGIIVDLAAFTNLSQDHLDFFPSMKEYAACKKSFFNRQHAKVCVVNADDELGKEIIAEKRIPCVSYGHTSPSDVFALDIKDEKDGLCYVINIFDDVGVVKYPDLHGIFNAYNTLCASTIARVFGIKLPEIIKGIQSVRRIDGRNETLYRHDGLKVVVDFAHTPDGINNILSYLKKDCKGKLITVFGCGGDRDRFKRPLMGKIVSKYSDYCIITNDNPRFEPPLAIIADIECGVDIKYEKIAERKEAILKALNSALPQDTVAILGKGAERYQEYEGRRIPYSDFDFLEEVLN